MTKYRARHVFLARKFGEDLKRIRLERGLLHKQLAYELGLTHTILTHAECGYAKGNLNTIFLAHWACLNLSNYVVLVESVNGELP